MKKRIDLSIIILNFNTKNLLRECLESIKNSELGNYSLEIIVVDNHSEDGSLGMVRSNFPWVRLFDNDKNLGFSKGNNIGLKKAIGEYVLILNPDTQVEKNTLRVTLGYLKNNQDVAATTCKVELVDGKLDESCHRGFPTPWNSFCHFTNLSKVFPQCRFFNGYHLGFCSLDKIHEIDACTGAFIMVRKEIGDHLNWFDEDYFWYGEDLDFCYRLKKAGFKLMYLPDVKILHWRGASSGIKKESRQVSTATSEVKKQAAYASTEAMRIFYGKHYMQAYPRILTDLILFGINIMEKFRLLKTNF